MDETLKFDPLPRERFPGYPLKGFYAPAPALKLPAPELTQVALSVDAPVPGRMELRVRSVRNAPKAFVIFPASAKIKDIEMATAAGPLRAKLQMLRDGRTVFVAPGIPEAGLRFWVSTPSAPMTVQIFDASYELPAELPDGKKLEQARPKNATSSQDGDVTMVQRTVRVDPAASR